MLGSLVFAAPALFDEQSREPYPVGVGSSPMPGSSVTRPQGPLASRPGGTAARIGPFSVGLEHQLLQSLPVGGGPAVRKPSLVSVEARVSEEGTTQVPFLLPYACASQVKVTGPGVKGSKTLDTSFPCAE
ncbi:hypothetical protein [Stigmatella aurantiaca]|uniref:Uncharacterized protein n=1 Tax=Stigmatella aurantiaca (strain DW4/3-1) TaxID=378806 RepID=E3FUF3_STIAD|nr:hypothetical protein [Stigmatella aurantiaca]ADO74651.1 uncharacterized protein STAUR_6895 [Stigmatella aurantiaca DW4/3-1]